MIIKIKNRSADAGSCMCCDKGRLSASGDDLIYPYTNVFVIKGDRNIDIVLCEECLSIINSFSKILKENPLSNTIFI